MAAEDGAGSIETPMGLITVRRARSEEVETVATILEEAADVPAARGIDQWRTSPFLRPQVARRIEQGEIYLAWLGDAAVGTLALQREDPLIWGMMPEDALYVHSLAIRPVYAGHQLGRHLLRWAEGRAAAAGKTYLRLDCMAENPRLNAYYREAGFTYRGMVGERRAASLYEKRVEKRVEERPADER